MKRLKTFMIENPFEAFKRNFFSLLLKLLYYFSIIFMKLFKIMFPFNPRLSN